MSLPSGDWTMAKVLLGIHPPCSLPYNSLRSTPVFLQVSLVMEPLLLWRSFVNQLFLLFLFSFSQDFTGGSPGICQCKFWLKSASSCHLKVLGLLTLISLWACFLLFAILFSTPQFIAWEHPIAYDYMSCTL